MPKPSTALLGAFFADHAGPATREACVAGLIDRYRISVQRAGEWLDHALETGTHVQTDAGISPRDLSPPEAVAHVLASHPRGLSWEEIVAAVTTQRLSPTRVSRAALKHDRVVASPSGTFRHRRFPEVAREPEAARSPVPTPAPAPAPQRAVPIVRRRAPPASAAPASEPQEVRVLGAIDRLVSSSTRAIEVQALRERLHEDAAIELAVDTVRSLLSAHAAELGWHVRGPFVSSREIPWPDLNTVIATAAKGRQRDPAELVARVRRLLRISTATARNLRTKLELVRSTRSHPVP
jgi:hypothetical protein